MKKYALLLAVPFMIASCGEDAATTDQAKTPAKTETTPETPAASNEVKVKITGDDGMKFNVSEIKVKSGQKVTIELEHTGKMAKGVMGHNFVLLKQGVNLSEFATEAMKFQDNEFIPKDTKDIIAHTKLIGGGETTTVTFDAPEKGEYQFLCSFTGHSAMMKGKFIVE